MVVHTSKQHRHRSFVLVLVFFGVLPSCFLTPIPFVYQIYPLTSPSHLALIKPFHSICFDYKHTHLTLLVWLHFYLLFFRFVTPYLLPLSSVFHLFLFVV